jgi:hypothetical protein
MYSTSLRRGEFNLCGGPPVAPLALMPTDTDKREVMCLSWLGPIGVAANLYASFVHRLFVLHGETMFAADTVAVCVSVMALSITVTPVCCVSRVARRYRL